MTIFESISEQLILGRAPKVAELVKEALNQSEKPTDIINNGLIYGMDIIGTKFKNNQVFVPEVMMAARAMKMAMEILKPLMLAEDMNTRGTVVIGTVLGDQHDIGKNLVSIMLESKGFKVIDLGVNVSPDKFVETALNVEANIIACSALLTTTMSNMKLVVEKVNSVGIHDRLKVIVGGAPVTQEFCDSIGADGYAADAAEASELALKLCSK